MKKFYFTLSLSALLLSVNAQQGGKKSNINHQTASYSLNKGGNDQISVVVCDSVASFAATDSLFLYTVPAASGGGYMAGNNGYTDKVKANFTNAALIPAGSTITGVLAIFYKGTVNGTKGSGAISMDILNGDTTNGPTGTTLGNAATTLTVITGTGTLIGNSLLYLFTFGVPVSAPAAGFFSALNLPTTTGDTAALFVTRNMAVSSRNYAWEKWSNNSWNSFGDPNNWDFRTSLTLLPIICYNTTGLHANVLEASLALYPNPNNGQFNFAIALPYTTNLTVNVVNTLGQSVFTKTENNISGGSLSYDLSSIGKGIYFVNITDSQNNKVVKKVVVQ